MIDTGRLAAYLATEFGLFLAPGPSVVFVLASGATQGWRGALGALAGNTAGLLIQLVIAVALLGGALDVPALSEGLKLAGAAWLTYLGARAIGRRRHDRGPAKTPPRRLLRDGLVVGLTNPKGLVTFTGFAPDLIRAHSGGRTVSLALLGLLAVAIAVVCDGAWGLAASAGQNLLQGSRARRAALELGSGLLMIAFGLGLAVITLA